MSARRRRIRQNAMAKIRLDLVDDRRRITSGKEPEAAKAPVPIAPPKAKAESTALSGVKSKFLDRIKGKALTKNEDV